MPVDPAPPVTRVVLIGLMASGKTTVGTALARRLGWRYRDNDDLLVELAGATARELNERLGADELHRLEAASVLAALGEDAPSSVVVSAAASTIEVERFRAALARPGVFAVWLRGDPVLLAQRMPSGPHRPVLETDAARLLAGQMLTRAPLFESVANLIIDIGSSTPDRLAADIAAALEGQLSSTRRGDSSTVREPRLDRG